MDSYATTVLPDADIIRQTTRNMRFVGIFAVIYGAMMCLSIIGAIVGIPYLISGLRLREAADELVQFGEQGDLGSIMRALELQNRYFFIQKVLIIVGIIIFALYMVAIFGFIVFGLSQGGSDLFNV